VDLTNKVIAVTGGAQGLGFAMAKGIAERGARLALIDMNSEPLEQAAASLRELGAEVATFVANVADEGSVIAAFDGIINQFGTLQGLINNAGITRDGLML
jgi:3-oxoacyl-[acyl-carrier protein] reductase